MTKLAVISGAAALAVVAMTGSAQAHSDAMCKLDHYDPCMAGGGTHENCMLLANTVCSGHHGGGSVEPYGTHFSTDNGPGVDQKRQGQMTRRRQ